MRYNSVHSVPSNLNVIKTFIYVPNWGRRKRERKGQNFNLRRVGVRKVDPHGFIFKDLGWWFRAAVSSVTLHSSFTFDYLTTIQA